MSKGFRPRDECKQLLENDEYRAKREASLERLRVERDAQDDEWMKDHPEYRKAWEKAKKLGVAKNHIWLCMNVGKFLKKTGDVTLANKPRPVTSEEPQYNRDSDPAIVSARKVMEKLEK